MRIFFYFVFVAFFRVNEFIYITRNLKDKNFNK